MSVDIGPSACGGGEDKVIILSLFDRCGVGKDTIGLGHLNRSSGIPATQRSITNQVELLLGLGPASDRHLDAILGDIQYEGVSTSLVDAEVSASGIQRNVLAPLAVNQVGRIERSTTIPQITIIHFELGVGSKLNILGNELALVFTLARHEGDILPVRAYCAIVQHIVSFGFGNSGILVDKDVVEVELGANYTTRERPEVVADVCCRTTICSGEGLAIDCTLLQHAEGDVDVVPLVVMANITQELHGIAIVDECRGANGELCLTEAKAVRSHVGRFRLHGKV